MVGTPSQQGAGIQGHLHHIPREATEILSEGTEAEGADSRAHR